MGQYAIIKVPRDTQGVHLLLGGEIEEVLNHDCTPVDCLRKYCERYPGELFYIVQVVEYAIGVQKVELVRTTAAP